MEEWEGSNKKDGSAEAYSVFNLSLMQHWGKPGNYGKPFPTLGWRFVLVGTVEQALQIPELVISRSLESSNERCMTRLALIVLIISCFIISLMVSS